RAAESITLQAGPWSLFLRAEAARGYPDVNAVIPSPEKARTRLVLDPEDARTLVRALPGLPGRDEPGLPVTLELGHRGGVVRARDQQGPVGEVALGRSRVIGEEQRL